MKLVQRERERDVIMIHRHEGASFIVVKGFKDARRCSFLGELDSHEESDQISDEFEFTHQILTADFEEELVQANITDSAVPFISRDKINELTSLSKDELITRMISMMQGTDLQVWNLFLLRALDHDFL